MVLGRRRELGMGPSYYYATYADGRTQSAVAGSDAGGFNRLSRLGQVVKLERDRNGTAQHGSVLIPLPLR